MKEWSEHKASGKVIPPPQKFTSQGAPSTTQPLERAPPTQQSSPSIRYQPPPPPSGVPVLARTSLSHTQPLMREDSIGLASPTGSPSAQRTKQPPKQVESKPLVHTSPVQKSPPPAKDSEERSIASSRNSETKDGESDSMNNRVFASACGYFAAQNTI